MIRSSRSGEAGFTLVEMLVGLAIVGLVSALLFVGIGRIGGAAALAGRRDARIEDVAAAQLLLRQLVERAQPIQDAQTGNTIDFAGTADGVDFIAPPPDGSGPGPLQRYRLRVDRRSGLMLYRVGSLDDTVDARQSSTQGWVPALLIGDASALSVRYFGATSGGGSEGWHPDWTHQRGLPLLVRIRLDLPERDERAWPDLVIRLRAANGDGCERDLRTDRCKGAGAV